MTDKLAWEDVHDPDDSDWKGFMVLKSWVQDDPISGVTFTAPVESGITITNNTVESPTTKGTPVKALLSGGNPGVWPILTTVTTASGRSRDKTIYLQVAEQ